MDSPMAPKPGRSLRAGLAGRSRQTHHHQPGLAADSASQPRPSFRARRGGSSRRRCPPRPPVCAPTARPSGCLRFAVKERLLRACTDHHGGRAFVQLAPLAQRVAAIGRFDLDHLGAELGEDAGTERAGDQGAEFQHLDAGEGFVHGWTIGDSEGTRNQRRGAPPAPGQWCRCRVLQPPPTGMPGRCGSP